MTCLRKVPLINWPSPETSIGLREAVQLRADVLQAFQVFTEFILDELLFRCPLELPVELRQGGEKSHVLGGSC